MRNSTKFIISILLISLILALFFIIFYDISIKKKNLYKTNTNNKTYIKKDINTTKNIIKYKNKKQNININIKNMKKLEKKPIKLKEKKKYSLEKTEKKEFEKKIRKLENLYNPNINNQ